MSIDWSTAPDRATCFAYGKFRDTSKYDFPRMLSDGMWLMDRYTTQDIFRASDYQPRMQQWPAEDRIDVIGQQGNDGLHYAETATKSAADYLSQGMQIITERGKQYGSNSRECSFPQVAEAFNAITGNELSGSDVCMILALLKLVRQSAQSDRLHKDSLVDGVNYMALYAEMVSKELTGQTSQS